MKTALLHSLLLCTLLFGGLPALAHAAPQPAPIWLAQQSGLSPAQAAARAEQQYGGRVLKIRNDGDRYYIKLLQDSGHVIHVSIDAHGGGGKNSGRGGDKGKDKGDKGGRF